MPNVLIRCEPFRWFVTDFTFWGGKTFLVWILIWQMHHAECWDPSVCEGGRVSRVLTSKLHHLEQKVPRFLVSHALKVILSKEHCNCAFLFGSLFCSRCISFEILFLHRVHSLSWKRTVVLAAESCIWQRLYVHQSPSTMMRFSPTRVGFKYDHVMFVAL